MFNKKLITIIAIIINCQLSIVNSIAQNDPKAKAILDELSAKTKAYTTIKADFALITEKKDHKKDTQNGKIQTKGKMYKLEIPGHEIYCDGKIVWDYIKDANEVQIKDMETSDDAINPSTVFTIYEKGFKYKSDGEDGITQIIALYPENPDKKKFHTAKLYVDKTKKQITSVIMLMKDGTSQTYNITSFLGNATIPDTDFTFNTKSHPGVSVEDLR